MASITLNSEQNPNFAIASIDSAERVNLTEIEAQIHQMQADSMRTFLKAVARGVTRVLLGTGRFIAAIWQGVAYARGCEQLQQLDDAALARMDLRREDIADHVFTMIYGPIGSASDPVLETIPGGKAKAANIDAETPERRAA